MIGNSFKQVSAIFNEYDIWKQYTEYRMNLNDRTAIYATRIKTHMNYNINECARTDIDNINSILFCGGSNLDSYYDIYGKELEKDEYFGKVDDLVNDEKNPVKRIKLIFNEINKIKNNPDEIKDFYNWHKDRFINNNKIVCEIVNKTDDTDYTKNIFI